jgi:5-methylthioadenosine/S-adenosylhomocysteine deaminase
VQENRSVMRMTLAAERSRSGAGVIAQDMGLQEVKLDHRDMPCLATTGGAEAWHLDDQVGNLTVGKQTDVIVIDSRHPHLTPLNDPVNTVVLNGGPSDFDNTVIVAGEHNTCSRSHYRIEPADSQRGCKLSGLGTPQLNP